MRVADLWLGPPPRGCETARGRQVGRGGPDERVDLVKDAATLRQGRRRRGSGRVNAPRAVRAIVRIGQERLPDRLPDRLARAGTRRGTQCGPWRPLPSPVGSPV